MDDKSPPPYTANQDQEANKDEAQAPAKNRVLKPLYLVCRGISLVLGLLAFIGPLPNGYLPGIATITSSTHSAGLGLLGSCQKEGGGWACSGASTSGPYNLSQLDSDATSISFFHRSRAIVFAIGGGLLMEGVVWIFSIFALLLTKNKWSRQKNIIYLGFFFYAIGLVAFGVLYTQFNQAIGDCNLNEGNGGLTASVGGGFHLAWLGQVCTGLLLLVYGGVLYFRREKPTATEEDATGSEANSPIGTPEKQVS